MINQIFEDLFSSFGKIYLETAKQTKKQLEDKDECLIILGFIKPSQFELVCDEFADKREREFNSIDEVEKHCEVWQCWDLLLDTLKGLFTCKTCKGESKYDTEHPCSPNENLVSCDECEGGLTRIYKRG